MTASVVRDRVARTLGTLFMEAQELRAALEQVQTENESLKAENARLAIENTALKVLPDEKTE